MDSEAEQEDNPPIPPNRRVPPDEAFLDDKPLRNVGLSKEVLSNALEATYHVVDSIDATLTAGGVGHLCQVVERANLSSMLGNIIGAELAKHSGEVYIRNGPNKYPDLLPKNKKDSTTQDGSDGIEIKMALDNNAAKGHHPKPGNYLTIKYVTLDANGRPVNKQNREEGRQPQVWEVRVGKLTNDCFNISNTDGDSGKTAVVNKKGKQNLIPVFHDRSVEPHSTRTPSRSASVPKTTRSKG